MLGEDAWILLTRDSNITVACPALLFRLIIQQRPCVQLDLVETVTHHIFVGLSAPLAMHIRALSNCL
jgi:hypothetical protein